MKRLRRLKIDFSSEPDGALRIAARHPAVGDMIVGFDDSEVSVFIGQITHCHFTPGACGDISASDSIEECVTESARYIHEVVSDEWVLWRYPSGAGGSYSDANSIDSPGGDAEQFRWSGPLNPEHAA
jgi:hypothetical protein